MFTSGKTPVIPRKSFEIAYALFRVTNNIPDTGFAGTLRSEATTLMTHAAKGDYLEAAKSITAIEYLVKLAAEADFVTFLNAETILGECGNLNAAIAESSNPAIGEIDLTGIFTNIASIKEQPLFHAQKREPRKESSESSETRQSAIIERIRQSGNCRLKDIQELFPAVSERTLRYDLQSLIEQSLVERVGTGGPAVFYRTKATV